MSAEGRRFRVYFRSTHHNKSIQKLSFRLTNEFSFEGVPDKKPELGQESSNQEDIISL